MVLQFINPEAEQTSKRIHYLLVQLKRAKVSDKTCIRAILKYASKVFHYSLPKYLSNDIERKQKRALRVVYVSINYN